MERCLFEQGDVDRAKGFYLPPRRLYLEATGGPAVKPQLISDVVVQP
jgi:hypothetical protein